MRRAFSATGHRRHRRHRAALLAIVGAVVCLAASSAPASAIVAGTRTWTGGAALGTPNWSNASNWVGGNGPGASDSVVFPNLAGCNQGANTCYTSHNDDASLSLTQFTISAAGSYTIDGNAITLGTGGLNLAADATSSSPGSSTVALPITLGANQTWSIDGNGNLSELTLTGAVTGTSRTVTVTLQNLAQLALRANMDVGPLTVAGSAANSGAAAATNGRLFLAGTSLNPLGSSVTLNNIDLVSTGGTIGGLLSTTGDFLEIGTGSGSTQTLTLNGPTTQWDPGSTVKMSIQKPAGATPTPGTENSEVIANGDLNLNNINLALLRTDFAACGTPVPVGTVYNLAHVAGGALTGTFKGLPDGSTVQVGPCTNLTTVRINYTATDATATVVPGPPAVATTTSLSVPSTATAGTQVTYTATVTAASGSTPPTGTVHFTDNGGSFGCDSQPVSGPAGSSSGTATCTVGSIGAGSHSIAATYVPASSSFSGSSDTKAFTATAASSGGGGGTTTTTTTTTTTKTTTPVVLPSGPSLAQVFAAIQSALAALAVQLHSFTPQSLGNHKVLFFNVAYLESGNVTISIFVTPQGHVARTAASKRVLLTKGSATRTTPGRNKIKLVLSKKGRNALKHANKARLGLVVTFTPTNNPKGKQTSSSSVTLRSKKTTKKKK